MSSQTFLTPLQHRATQATAAPDFVFHNIVHHLDETLLLEACQRLRHGKKNAPGIDGQTAAESAKDVFDNLRDLHERLTTGRYRATPMKRRWIPKEDGSPGQSLYVMNSLDCEFSLQYEVPFALRGITHEHFYQEAAMGHDISRSLETHFQDVQDPRRHTLNQRHKFIDILVIAVCGAICGANDWVAVATFGKAKEDWLQTFLELPNGIPSHDTFTDVFSKLLPEQFQQGFISWVSSLVTLFPGEGVAIDGKTLRHSYDAQDSRASIHMAWV